MGIAPAHRTLEGEGRSTAFEMGICGGKPQLEGPAPTPTPVPQRAPTPIGNGAFILPPLGVEPEPEPDEDLPVVAAMGEKVGVDQS